MNVLAQNLHFLSQGVGLLSDLDSRLFRSADTDGGGGRIGAHFRHVIDFYRCFIGGLESGRVNYDARERDPDLENQPEKAVRAMREIATALEGLTSEDGIRTLSVKADSEDPLDPSSWSASSVSRELVFLTSHTVHHYALIALLLRHNGYDTDASFGVAPSTLEYRAAAAS